MNRTKKPKVTFKIELHEETEFLPVSGANWSLHLRRFEDGILTSSGCYLGQYHEENTLGIAEDLARTLGGHVPIVRLTVLERRKQCMDYLRKTILRYRTEFIPRHESRLNAAQSEEQRQYWQGELDKSRAIVADGEKELLKLEGLLDRLSREVRAA